MSGNDPIPLPYATPTRPVGSPWQRALYCVGLPVFAFGLACAFNPGDRAIAMIAMPAGALLVAFALPVWD